MSDSACSVDPPLHASAVMGAMTMDAGIEPCMHLRTLVLSDEQSPRSTRSERDRLFVATPLDMIAHLELASTPVSTVVLAGRYGGDRELASFLLESYPMLRIVDVAARNPL